MQHASSSVFGEQFQYARHVFLQQEEQQQKQQQHEQLLFTAISVSGQTPCITLCPATPISRARS